MAMQIDEEKLLAFLKHFFIISGVRVVVFDTEFQHVLAYPQKSSLFCRKIRETEQGDARCCQSDITARQRLDESGLPYIFYTCHAGLTDAIARIEENGSVIGYMMFGQCVSADIPLDEAWQAAVQSCEAFKDIADLRNEFYTLPRRSTSQLEACAQMMNAGALYISLKNYVQPAHDYIFATINHYINTHLHQELSVEVLGNELFLPRNVIYRVVKDETALSPGQFVRERRLKYAEHLLCKEEHSIAEIAEMCGISDFNYFSRVFKKEYGVSPREYRSRAIPKIK